MKTIEIESFVLGDITVTSLTVSPLNFLAHVRAAAGATTIKDQQRRRMRAMVRLNGELISEEQIASLPVKVGLRVLAGMNDDQLNGPRGELLTPGADGIDTPILYRLGTPLTMKRKGGEVVKIEELEIQAKTFGDIEDIVAAESRMAQAIEMLKRVTVPVGVSGLTILPEALLNQITPSDGLMLALEVVPNFTD